MKAALHAVATAALLLPAAGIFAVPAAAQSSTSGCDSGHCRPAKVYHHGVRYVSPSHYGYGPAYTYRPVVVDRRLGTAEIIRARAQANLLNADARTQHLHADRLQMENSVEFLATRLERQRINKETRFGHLHARGEQVRHQKMAAAQAHLASHRPRPSVDPITGQVAWPMLLRSSYFEKARRPIEMVFHQRSLVGSINPDHFLPMRDWIEKIQRELKANVAYYEMEDYLEAKDFLRTLVDEARRDLPADTTTQFVAGSK